MTTLRHTAMLAVCHAIDAVGRVLCAVAGGLLGLIGEACHGSR